MIMFATPLNHIFQEGKSPQKKHYENRCRRESKKI
jgi:hypothetical protein